jgi:sialidase-1
MKHRLKKISGLLIFLFSVGFALAQDNELTLRIEPESNNPRNSEGDFVTLKDGSILFVYSHFTGTSGGDFGAAFLSGRYSKDNGKTWTSEDVSIIKQEGKMNVMSVSLLRLKNGEIALSYVIKNSAHDCIPYMRTSADEAKTWSGPVRCITDKTGYFVLNNSRVIQLKNGRLIMPVAQHKITDEDLSKSDDWQNGFIYCYYSDDNGLTWNCSEEVKKPEKVITQEPGVVELKNGDVMMYIRTYSGIQYVSYSKDKGKTWSVSIPSDIKSPCSPASIKRIPSTGDLLLVWNNNGENQKRTPYNIAVSQDEGKTWKYIKTLENDSDGWYCYSAIHFTKKFVLLSYCAGSQSKKTHLSVTNIRKVSLDWIYN